ncbi:MAG: type VI secretion system contractile sheath small subunit [Aliishimia sp.]
MASDKATDFIKRNRPPRVNIAYEDPYDSEQMVELPFVMGIMSDLSGNAPAVEKAPLEERDFADVTAATLDTYMESVGPGVSVNVDNKLDEDSKDRIGVNLSFSSMNDFGPAEIAKQVPSLNKLLEARQHLANLQRYMNSKPKAQEKIKELLNDPDLMSALAEREKADGEGDS